MPADRVLTLIEMLAPALVAGALLLALLRHLDLPLPARLLLRVGLVVVALVGAVAAIDALDGKSPGPFLIAWFIASLPVYLARRWYEGAARRESERESLLRDRGQERRRAPPQGGVTTSTSSSPVSSSTRSTP